MPDFTRRAVKGIGPELQSGETILKSLVAQPPGSLARGLREDYFFGADFYDGSGTRAAQQEKARHASEASGLAAQIPPRNVYLTLTDRRVLVHTLTRLGSPEERVAEFRFDQIAALDFESKRFGNGVLHVTFSDGTGADVDIIQRQKPEGFMSAWATVTGAS